MSTSTKPATYDLPPDFPNEPILGAVGGVQLKLTLRRNEDGTYGSPRRSPEEIMHRFEVADDLVGQLVVYFKRKKAEFPAWTDEKNLERIRLALIQKAAEGKWAFSSAEQIWIMSRLRQRCLGRLESGPRSKDLMLDSPSETERNTLIHEKSTFGWSRLGTKTPSTADIIMRLIAEERVAEMSSGQAGDEEQL